jgi:spore maturation protein SpmA
LSLSFNLLLKQNNNNNNNFQSHREGRQRLSFLAVASMTIVLVLTVVLIFVYKAILNRSKASNAMLLLPSVLNSVQITIFGILFKKVTRDKRNKQTNKQTHTHTHTNTHRSQSSFNCITL